LSSAASNARPFRSAGSGGLRGRPSTNIDQGPRSRALVAARRYRNQQENRPEGGALGPVRTSIMGRGELTALRAAQVRDNKRRDAINLAPLDQG
jgi:hypothetical protein